MNQKAIPKNLSPVNEVPKKLGSVRIKIGYTGLMHYRNLGLIPPPQKIKGYKERFYNIERLAARINAVHLIAAIFKKNFERIAELAKKLPEDVFNMFPVYYMKMYAELIISAEQRKGEEKEIQKVLKNKLSYLGSIVLGNVYWTIVSGQAKRSKDKTSKEFYGMICRKYPNELKDTWNAIDKETKKKLIST